MVDFSLKQVRHDLVERSNSRGDLNQHITSKIVVPKVNCFVWRATTRKITTAMWPWRPFGDEFCPMCGIVNEKADRFLVECSFSKSVWWLHHLAALKLLDSRPYYCLHKSFPLLFSVVSTQ
ncbi:putative reverse transcriptase zinc-binding domain-containing protein [Helianthus annuus]|nr:putative reverse transcriptase zinc-binding domain-containing protein [Helianthus annuus]KAJ0894260.1 putative reverse transcriptase zinc-binding domain-containing protein [Helianthus annuus]